MTAIEILVAADGVCASTHVLDVLFGTPEERVFNVRFWDGTAVPAGRPARFTLVLQHPGALRRMLLPPSELRLGEAFVWGDVDLEGDLETAVGLAEVLHQRLQDRHFPVRLMRAVARLPRSPNAPRLRNRRADADGAADLHSPARDRAAVRSHYDVGNDFYRLWLDPRMIYSCAYFETGAESLAAAQEAKLDLVCRKLRLGPGDRLLDIGCGWGALVERAGARYGARASGVTLSEPQANVADERLFDAGLAGRCGAAALDYRQLGPPREYHKLASIGMVEHVGRARIAQYFRIAYSVLRPGGLFLNHGIVAAPEPETTGVLRTLQSRLWRSGEFVDRYVFPDGELLTLAEVIAAAAQAGFEVCDVESLRPHYAETLRHWVRRLEARQWEAVSLAGGETFRTWRLYMAASAYAFASGRLNVCQVLLAKRDGAGRRGLPLTRRDLYVGGRTAPEGLAG
ncbi:MAG: class I SAM-dependent methyltransferase [Gemmatimonadaceae bacterium]